MLSTFHVFSEGFNRIQMSFKYLSIWQVIVTLFKWPPSAKHKLSHRFLYFNTLSIYHTYHWNSRNHRYHKHIEYVVDMFVRRWYDLHVSTKCRYYHLSSIVFHNREHLSWYSLQWDHCFVYIHLEWDNSFRL